MLCTCAQYLTAACREESEEHRYKTCHSMVLQGKLWMAVQWITERGMGGVLHPEEHYTKSGKRVMEVLRTKNPDARPPSLAILDSYKGQSPEKTRSRR